MIEIDYTYKTKILNVVSGDTVWVDLDLGVRSHKKERLRLTGIVAPRINSTLGLASKTALETLCGEFCFVTLSPEGSYGRWTGVFYDTQGDNINERLVASGHAKSRS